MNDKNGMRIWDGDYVVGTGPGDDVYEGTVVGKVYDPSVILVMNDDGRITKLNPQKVEIQEMVGAEPVSDCGPFIWPPVTGKTKLQSF